MNERGWNNIFKWKYQIKKIDCSGESAAAHSSTWGEWVGLTKEGPPGRRPMDNEQWPPGNWSNGRTAGHTKADRVLGSSSSYVVVSSLARALSLCVCVCVCLSLSLSCCGAFSSSRFFIDFPSSWLHSRTSKFPLSSFTLCCFNFLAMVQVLVLRVIVGLSESLV
jgi:hypothetical protein